MPLGRCCDGAAMTEASGPTGTLNLARFCLEARAGDPATADRTAFTFVRDDGDKAWTYADLWARIQRIGRGLLARGLEPGDRVLLRLPHSPDYAFAFFGATSFARSQRAPSLMALPSSHYHAPACVAASLPSIQTCWWSSSTPVQRRLMVHAGAEPSGTRKPVGFKW